MPKGYTGSTNDNGATCNTCHNTDPDNSGSGAMVLSLPSDSYVEDEEIEVTLKLLDYGFAHTWGFSCMAEDAEGERVGEWEKVEHDEAVKAEDDYVRSKELYSGTADSVSWSFIWEAPEEDEGVVFFYCTSAFAVPDNVTLAGLPTGWTYTEEASLKGPSTIGVGEGGPTTGNSFVFYSGGALYVWLARSGPVTVKVFRVDGSLAAARSSGFGAGLNRLAFTLKNGVYGVMLRVNGRSSFRTVTVLR